MRWDPKTTIVLAILAVAVIIVLIQAVVLPRRDADGDEAGFKDRCAAANGVVHGKGNDRTCVAADGSVITLP